MGLDATPGLKRPSGNSARTPLKEAALFLAVGGTATLLNMVFYAGLVNLCGVEPTSAAALSFLLVVPFHFISYARIVFPPDRFDSALFVRYVLALALSFCLNVGLVAVFWGKLGAQPMPAQILGLIPAILANYLSFKFFVFRSQQLNAPSLAAHSPLTTATIVVSGATVYAAIAAMLMNVGPAPVAETADALKADALHTIFDRTAGPSRLLPEFAVRINAILFGSAPSIIAILETGIHGLTGLLLALVGDKLQHTGKADWRQRLAAALTVLAAVMVLNIAAASAEPSIEVGHALVVLWALVAALLASGFAGPLTHPGAAGAIIAAALMATLSDEAGTLVWLLVPTGWLLTHRKTQTTNRRALNVLVLLSGFAVAASFIYGADVYLALLAATLITAVIAALPLIAESFKPATKTRETILVAIALILFALAYQAIALS